VPDLSNSEWRQPPSEQPVEQQGAAQQQATQEQIDNFKTAFSLCREAKDYMVKY